MKSKCRDRDTHTAAMPKPTVTEDNSSRMTVRRADSSSVKLAIFESRTPAPDSDGGTGGFLSCDAEYPALMDARKWGPETVDELSIVHTDCKRSISQHNTTHVRVVGQHEIALLT